MNLKSIISSVIALFTVTLSLCFLSINSGAQINSLDLTSSNSSATVSISNGTMLLSTFETMQSNWQNFLTKNTGNKEIDNTGVPETSALTSNELELVYTLYPNDLLASSNNQSVSFRAEMMNIIASSQNSIDNYHDRNHVVVRTGVSYDVEEDRYKHYNKEDVDVAVMKIIPYQSQSDVTKAYYVATMSYEDNGSVGRYPRLVIKDKDNTQIDINECQLSSTENQGIMNTDFFTLASDGEEKRFHIRAQHPNDTYCQIKVTSFKLYKVNR